MVITLGAVVGSLSAAVGWLASIPKEVLYIFFLASLAIETGAGATFGFQSGPIAGILSLIVGTLLNIPGLQIPSYLVLAIFMLWYPFKFALAH